MSEVKSIDELLDADLDSFADMPEFIVPPAGNYEMTIESMESKTIVNHPVMEIKFKINATVELNDPHAAPVADGTQVSSTYFLDNDLGQGQFKRDTAMLREATGATTTRALMEAVKGMDVIVVSKVRANKNDASKQYFTIVELYPV